MPSSSSLSYVPLFMLVVISRRGRSMISCIKLPCFFSSALYDLHNQTAIKNGQVGPFRHENGTTVKYMVSSMQPDLASQTTQRCKCLTLLHAM